MKEEPDCDDVIGCFDSPQNGEDEDEVLKSLFTQRIDVGISL
jgi:hypothetical protein